MKFCKEIFDDFSPEAGSTERSNYLLTSLIIIIIITRIAKPNENETETVLKAKGL